MGDRQWSAVLPDPGQFWRPAEFNRLVGARGANSQPVHPRRRRASETRVAKHMRRYGEDWTRAHLSPGRRRNLGTGVARPSEGTHTRPEKKPRLWTAAGGSRISIQGAPTMSDPAGNDDRELLRRAWRATSRRWPRCSTAIAIGCGG